jgi:chaperonin GroES
MNLKPNLEKIIVERRQSEDISAGGILMPEAAKEDLNEGTVVAVEEAEPLFKVGTYIIFNAYSGTEVSEGGKTYLVIGNDDVIAYRTDV